MTFQDAYFFPIEKPATYFFSGSTVSESLAYLTKFQNSIKINENRMIAFCNNKVGSTDGAGFYTIYRTIIGQSSTIVKPGERIVITSGIGSFSKASQPQVYINNKLVELDEGAVAKYFLKAPLKPGSYSLPINIVYADQDGIRRAMASRIEYMVSNCGN